MPDAGPVLLSREFRLPRRGHGDDECQDAAAAAPESGRFAVADGAAESAFAALWARLLVEDFVRAPEPSPAAWAARLPALQARWADEVGDCRDDALPWYLEAGLQQGAFATFLGLVVEGAGGSRGRWQALAVGDSCLFQVRQGRLLESFPLARSADFGNAPWLVGSRTSADRVPRRNGHRRQGAWRADDRLWLMTDALAQWFLGQAETGGKPWEALDRLLAAPAPAEAFAGWVEEQRRLGRLRNDDVTLVGVCL